MRPAAAPKRAVRVLYVSGVRMERAPLLVAPVLVLAGALTLAVLVLVMSGNDDDELLVETLVGLEEPLVPVLVVVGVLTVTVRLVDVNDDDDEPLVKRSLGAPGLKEAALGMAGTPLLRLMVVPPNGAGSGPFEGGPMAGRGADTREREIISQKRS